MARAERYPIKLYTTEEGLPSSHVTRIVQDSHGYLWFCTVDGLARFDGHNFKAYGAQDGLSHPGVNDLLETRAGVYWVATNGHGIFRFTPHPAIDACPAAPRFIRYTVGARPDSNMVNVLFEDHAGRIWAGTDGGLFVLDGDAFAAVALDAPIKPTDTFSVQSVVEGPEGSLWVGGSWDMVRLPPNGRPVQYTVEEPLKRRDIGGSLSFDGKGRLWVGSRAIGLFVFNPEPITGAAPKSSVRRLVPRQMSGSSGGKLSLPTEPGKCFHYSLANNGVTGIRQGSEGRIWIATFGGLVEYDGERLRHYTTSHGLSENAPTALGEDSAGNLWIGTETRGAMRLARGGFITYTEADGLGHSRIASIFEDLQGELCVTSVGEDLSINRFEGGRFHAIRPKLRRGIYGGWGWNQLALQDRTGEWWVPTGEGLYRYGSARVDQLSRIGPKAVYTTLDGLGGDNIFRLFEDSRGDIWIATLPSNPAQQALTRWERSTGRFHTYPNETGLPADAPTAFCEDRSGQVWVGFYTGGVARARENRFTFYGPADGVPGGQVRALYMDSESRLWVATNSGGLGCIVDPEAETPSFRAYTVDTGLASNNVRCITEDQWGRIYTGTARGVDRLDVSTGGIRHYSVADGLASSGVIAAHRDRRGWLWFGTLHGLSRLAPEPDQPRPPSSVVVTGLRIGGIVHPLSELGESEILGIEAPHSRNEVHIDFSAVSFGIGETLSYQFMLEGVDQSWSRPADQRTVNFVRLAPGNYRFLVRSINSDGMPSSTLAIVGFTISPPLWQRWWFLSLALALAGMAIYTIHRYRVARLVELERIRTRIATDLHDDIGSNLSQIAILTEVARNQASRGDASSEKQLSIVARIARESVDSMSDIVWAINPQRDWLGDLVGRMRRFASEILPARGVEFQFSADLPERDITLGADVRRQIFLIFKECVNNIVRHSECTQANIGLWTEGSWLVMKLSDNGKGYDPEAVKRGQGLASIRRRAESLGGELQITTRRHEGTAVTLRVPLTRRALLLRGIAAKRES